MTMEISFYQLTQGAMDKSVAKVLEKVQGAGLRSVMLFENPETLDAYNKMLWTFSSLSFLPHGSATDGAPLNDPKQQPLWLTPTFENPNGADVVACVEGTLLPDVKTFKRCLDIFNGHDDDAVLQARKRWVHYKDLGCVLTYWKQSESGRWEKQDL